MSVFALSSPDRESIKGKDKIQVKNSGEELFLLPVFLAQSVRFKKEISMLRPARSFKENIQTFISFSVAEGAREGLFGEVME